MTRLLELNRQEINEKLQLIKVLEKEKAYKQALCDELRLSSKETQDDLVDSKNTLKLAAETVEQLLDKEKQLMEQAQTIPAAANCSIVDTHKINDKLDRERSVDQEICQISQGFCSEFHKKITQIEGDISNYSNAQLSALNEMRKRLDEIVQKRNERLSTLRDDIASLINIQTNTLQTWSKKSFEKINAAQQNKQNLLQNARSIADTEINSVHSFLTERLLPFTQNIQHHILCEKAENDGSVRLVTEQIQRRTETLATFTRMQLEALSQLRHTVSVHIQKIHELSEQMQNNNRKTQEANEKYNEELFSSIQKLTETAQNIERRHQDFLTEEKDRTETVDDLKLIQQNAEKANLIVATAVEAEVTRCSDLLTSIDMHGEETAEIVKGFLERVSTVTNGIEECSAEVESVVRREVSDTETAWLKQKSFLEQQLRSISENISETEKLHQEHTQLLTGNLHVSAHTHEMHTEKQRMAYASFIRGCNLSLENEYARTSDWHYSIESRLQGRDKDVEQFSVEFLRQDVPTGTTPQRRQFNYPTTLASSTPTRIMGTLQKIHEAAQLENNQVISEDGEAEGIDSIVGNEDVENTFRTPVSLPKSKSNEDINKENSIRGGKSLKKLLKSASSNNKSTPQRPFNTIN